MHRSLFFKLFPPPKFMVMRYAGLDISDDSVHFIDFCPNRCGSSIQKFATAPLPEGTIIDGHIKDEETLKTVLKQFAKENGLTHVKVSVPEEMAYLFQTEVPQSDVHTIGQNIEFKLEESVPLTAKDAIFYFDLMPLSVSGGELRASVSVVPRSYIEHFIGMLSDCGLSPVAFEVVPKALARAVVPSNHEKAVMIAHMMAKKTGVYIVSDGVVCFSSTVPWGSRMSADGRSDIGILVREIARIQSYWISHSGASSAISEMILVGKEAPMYMNTLRSGIASTGIEPRVANVWQNAFDINEEIPIIQKEDSLNYAVSAGLALDI